MKNRIIKTVITLLTSTLLLGCNTLEVNKTESEQTAQTIRNDIDFGNVEIYHSTSKEEFDRLTPILENRNGKIIIEVIDGTVLQPHGAGWSQLTQFPLYIQLLPCDYLVLSRGFPGQSLVSCNLPSPGC